MKLLTVLFLATFGVSCVLSAANLSATFDVWYYKDNNEKTYELEKNLEFIDALTNRKLIKISDGPINELSKEFLSHFKDTVYLSFSDCSLSDIEESAFEDLKKLKAIEIKSNNLFEITRGIFNGLKIKALSLENSGIRYISSNAFDDMPNLRILNLEHNMLYYLVSDWFGKKPMLTTILLSYNKIDSLNDNDFEHLSKSRKCDFEATDDDNSCPTIILSYNRINSVALNAFSNAKKIEKLVLDHNQLSDLPDFPTDFQLKVLSVQYNSISYAYQYYMNEYCDAVNSTYLYGNPLVAKNLLYIDYINNVYKDFFIYNELKIDTNTYDIFDEI